MSDLQSALETVDEDWLTDVIDDSIDMDWTGRVGAQAIIRALSKLREEQEARKVCGVCGTIGTAEHKGFCSESYL